MSPKWMLGLRLPFRSRARKDSRVATIEPLSFRSHPPACNGDLSCAVCRLAECAPHGIGEQTSSGLALGSVDIAFGAGRLDVPVRPERVQAANADAADLFGHARVE